MILQTNHDVHQLLDAPWHVAALTAALKLGLFWRLANQPRASDAIALEMNIPQWRCHYWLGMLAAMNLLEQEGDYFEVSPLARSAVLEAHSQEAWAMLAVDVEDNLEDSFSLAERLSEPVPERDEEGRYRFQHDPYVRKMTENLARARHFCNLLYELHTPLAEEVAATLDVGRSRSLMDVGGGSGVVSLALLRKHPALKATVVDVANVCAAGREIADRLPEGDRISYVAANLVEEDLPKGFDIVLKCDVSIFDDFFLAKLAASLNDGGRLVIVDRWFKTGERETSGRLAFMLSKTLRNPDYQLRSLEDIENSLEQAGLAVQPLVDLNYRHWKMIQAVKGLPLRIGQREEAALVS